MMKSIGVVRKLDDLGRIVIPKEIRRVNDLKEHDPMEIFTDGEDTILRPYRPGCVFCGRPHDAVYRDRRVCKGCIAELKAT